MLEFADREHDASAMINTRTGGGGGGGGQKMPTPPVFRG